METLIYLLLFFFTLSVHAQTEKEHVSNNGSIAVSNNEKKEDRQPQPDDKKFTQLQALPKYPGGEQAFIKKIQDSIDISLLKEIPPGKYRVYISFKIGADGVMTEKEISRDPGYGLGTQVLAILSGLNDTWTPGISQGKPVAVRYQLPVTVKIP